MIRICLVTIEAEKVLICCGLPLTVSFISFGMSLWITFSFYLVSSLFISWFKSFSSLQFY